MIRRPPRSTLDRSSAASDVYKRQWLYNKTDKGRLQFLQVRDGSGICQAVVFKKNVSEAAFDAARRLTQESSLIVSGTVRAEERAPGIPGGFELDVTDLEAVSYTHLTLPTSDLV